MRMPSAALAVTLAALNIGLAKAQGSGVAHSPQAGEVLPALAGTYLGNVSTVVVKITFAGKQAIIQGCQQHSRSGIDWGVTKPVLEQVQPDAEGGFQLVFEAGRAPHYRKLYMGQDGHLHGKYQSFGGVSTPVDLRPVQAEIGVCAGMSQ